MGRVRQGEQREPVVVFKDQGPHCLFSPPPEASSEFIPLLGLSLRQHGTQSEWFAENPASFHLVFSCFQKELSIDASKFFLAIRDLMGFISHRNSWNEIKVLQCLNLNLRTQQLSAPFWVTDIFAFQTSNSVLEGAYLFRSTENICLKYKYNFFAFYQL